MNMIHLFLMEKADRWKNIFTLCSAETTVFLSDCQLRSCSSPFACPQTTHMSQKAGERLFFWTSLRTFCKFDFALRYLRATGRPRSRVRYWFSVHGEVSDYERKHFILCVHTLLVSNYLLAILILDGPHGAVTSNIPLDPPSKGLYPKNPHLRGHGGCSLFKMRIAELSIKRPWHDLLLSTI